jgi:hypothetical protein
MYGKLAMACLKYQVYLYGPEAITYLNAFLWVVTEPSTMSHQTAPAPHYRQPSPHSVWQHNLHPFEREL